jgi:4-hydroxybenzoate-CoA ligase/benzoate-CoA ligase
VALLSLDCPEWVTSFFGAIKVGAVVIGVNTLLTTEEYAFVLRDALPRVLIVHEALLAKIAPALDEVGCVEHVVVIGGASAAAAGVASAAPGAGPSRCAAPLREGHRGFAKWIGSESVVWARFDAHRDDICSLNYSSGTTGEP